MKPTLQKKTFGRYIDLNIAVTAVFVVFTFMMLAVKNGFMLRWYDEMSLFESTGFFFQKSVHYPGGLLRYAGMWLTQFMYYPWLGTGILVALWLLLAWMTRKAFRLSGDASPLSYIVPLALFVSVAHLDEACVSMQSSGYLFFPTLGYIFTIVGILAYRMPGNRTYLRILWIIVLAACYPIAGFFALLSAFICIILEIAAAIRGKIWWDLGTAAVVIAFGVLVPQIYYLYFPGNTVDNDYLYLKGLPDFYLMPYDVYLWTPFIVGTAFLIVLGILTACRTRLTGKIWRAVSLVVFVVCAIWGCAAEKKSEQLRATVLMVQAIDRGEWDKVIDIMWRIKEYPNYTMRMLSNVAAMNLGESISDVSRYKPENSDARHSEQFTVTAFINVPVNYHIGELNQSYRWAMEHTVQYGKRVFFLKYMIKDALLNGETALARRYNDILRHTMFHHRWAKDMQRYIDDPTLIDGNPEFREIRQANANAIRNSLIQ